jgi:hypothetical protein
MLKTKKHKKNPKNVEKSIENSFTLDTFRKLVSKYFFAYLYIPRWRATSIPEKNLII